jgi:putative spermidine/putrescine transport system permease protein
VHRFVGWAIGWAVLLYLVFPLAVIVAASFDPGEFFTFPPTSYSTHWYEQVVSDPGWRRAGGWSLLVAATIAVLSATVGTLAGIAIGRSGRRWRRLLLAVAVAPQVIPGIVIAVSFYIFALKLELAESFLALVVANAIATLSVVVLLVAAQVISADERTELAARACGAGPLRTLLTVTLPAVAPSALAGTALATIFTLDEVVISQFLVTGRRATLPVKMYQEVAQGTPAVVNAISSLMIALGFAAAIVRVMVQRRRQTGI